MRRTTLCLLLLLIEMFMALSGYSQSPGRAASEATVVPTLVKFSGIARDSRGKPMTGVLGIAFALYEDDQTQQFLWRETQNVTADETGHYTVSLGLTEAHGIPREVFASGAAKWLGVQINGETEQPRVLLLSVPYALKAADSDSLGGLPASAFALARNIPKMNLQTIEPQALSPNSVANVTNTGGVSGYLSRFSGSNSIVDSPVFANAAGLVGIGTTAPTGTLHVKGNTVLQGKAIFPQLGAATTAAGFTSQPLDLYASSYSSSLKAPEYPYIQLQAEPAGNNSASPSATLHMLSSNGTGNPAETGLSFNADGTIHFAVGQTFPAAVITHDTTLKGTGASTSPLGLTLPLSLTGTSTATTITAVGGASSGLSGTAAIRGDSATLTGVIGESGNAAGVYGVSKNYQGVVGQTASSYPAVEGKNTGAGSGVEGTIAGNTINTAGVYGIAGPASGYGGIAGIWGDAANHVGSFGSSVNYAGVAGQSTKGPGVQGISSTNQGVFGRTDGATLGTAGILGQAGSSAGYGGIAGVWGDAADHVGTFGGSINQPGVAGQSVNSTGVQGISSVGNGVVGRTNGSTLNTAGVYGQIGASAGYGGVAAVWGDSADHVGTFGGSTNYAGVAGQSNTGPGVEGTSAGTDGVQGFAHSANGSGVAGFNDALGGIGVYGKSSNSGFGFFTPSNVHQERGYGGWVKAMAVVSYTGNNNLQITSCYNSQATGAAVYTVPCGMTFTHNQLGINTIDFGFQIDDRYVSATPIGFAATTGLGTFLNHFGITVSLQGTQMTTVTYYLEDKSGHSVGQETDTAFHLVVF